MSVDDTLLRAVRHNTWANLELLAFCATLSAAQLAWTAPGTYGTLHRTLHHIVGAEHGYLFGLTGALPPIEVEGRGKPMMGDWAAPIAELIERESSNGERIERALGAGFDATRMIKRPRGNEAVASIIAVQFIHHGTDHRSHVGTILGANGVEPPSLDVWAYGRTTGEVTPVP